MLSQKSHFSVTKIYLKILLKALYKNTPFGVSGPCFYFLKLNILNKPIYFKSKDTVMYDCNMCKVFE